MFYKGRIYNIGCIIIKKRLYSHSVVGARLEVPRHCIGSLSQNPCPRLGCHRKVQVQIECLGRDPLPGCQCHLGLVAGMVEGIHIVVGRTEVWTEM